DRLHSFFGQRTRVFDRLLADAAPTRLFGRIIGVSGLASQHTTRTDSLPHGGILRIKEILRILLRVEMIEIAVELVKTMHRRQVLIAIAEMILSELSGGVTQRLEELGDRYVARLQADRRAGNADLREPGPQCALAGNERRSPRSATLLSVVIGENHSFLRD